MKNLSFCILLTINVFGFSLLLNSQNNSYSDANHKNAYAEKVYVQLNNTVFTSGSTIWFKVIVTSAMNHSLSDLSGIVYVELIDFDKNVVSKKKLKLVGGIADSFFNLDASLPVGRYLVRAYTKWNMNFGDDFIFSQYIEILSASETSPNDAIRDIRITQNTSDYQINANIFPQDIKQDYNKPVLVYLYANELVDSLEIKPEKGVYALEYNLPEETPNVKLKVKLRDTKLKNFNVKKEPTFSKTIAVNENLIDLQFFPEGGKLVDGLTTKVGFKCLDYQGLGKRINGQIVNELDQTIAEFSTNNLGMGYVLFTPKASHQYFGKLVGSDNVVYKYPLPEILDIGYTLMVSKMEDYLKITVSSNLTEADSLSLVFKSRGKRIHRYNFELHNGIHHALIDNLDLPDGILKITLLDEKKNPLCERLYFNAGAFSRLSVSAKPNLSVYDQRDKAIVRVDIADLNETPQIAELSVLVHDKTKTGEPYAFKPNILSYFLLNSELKGTIETPNHYFKPDNNYANRDLDALMLTQGWRNYVYRNKSDYRFDIEPETDFWVSGDIRKMINNKKPPKGKIDLTLLTLGKTSGVYTQKADSLGRFKFNLSNEFADKLSFVIQSTNNKGVNKDYSITLDKTFDPPKIDYLEKEIVQLPDSIITPFLKEEIQRQKSVEAFQTDSNTIALDEVEITGYKLTPVREKVMKLYGKPDIVIEGKDMEKNEDKWMNGTIFDILKFRYPDDIEIISRSSSIFGSFDLINVRGSCFTFILFDGIPAKRLNYPFIPETSPDQVASFEIIRNPKNLCEIIKEVLGVCDGYPPCRVSVINIITYSGKGFYGLNRTKGIFKGVVDGFSPKREFYTPKYNNLKDEDWKVPDLREVVYWSPSVQTDTNGKAQIEFYNGDNTGDMQVIVEAITPDGKIGYVETEYTVEKKLEK
ncbi:MAG: hypothetical protein ACON5F_01840 [Jejuia sp.]